MPNMTKLVLLMMQKRSEDFTDTCNIATMTTMAQEKDKNILIGKNAVLRKHTNSQHSPSV